MWLDAACQIFYSFSLAFGGLIAFASYNPPDYNCKRDVIYVSICNVATALFASISIFSILGHKAYYMFNTCITGFAFLVKILISKFCSSFHIINYEFEFVESFMQNTLI